MGGAIFVSVCAPHALRAQSATARADSLERELRRLEERVESLERAKTAQEDATRAVIRDALATADSKINSFVTLGGTFEMAQGWAEDTSGGFERLLLLNTAELDFEIQVGPWTLGSVVFEYDDGTDTLLRTSDDGEASVDRINVDTAFLTLGDTQQFVPYTSLGRLIVPFGISTGDPVADVLTLEDPLTVEVFETREDAWLVGLGFPTPPRPAARLAPRPPPVRPRVLNPFFGKLSRGLGYRPPPAVPPPTGSELTLPPAPPPRFHVGAYVYNGATRGAFRRHGWHPEEHWGATLGYRNTGAWSVDVDVDYNNSVFDSRFLETEYAPFLDQIDLVPGMAASVKANLGRVGFVGEWNGALDNATFRDDANRAVAMRPGAWQVSLAYQFDWNPWVESIGSQGTYVAVGYSESYDLNGVTRLVDGEPERVGTVPESRFLVSAGEWVLDGVRFAVEYSRVVDYPRGQGGTGKSAHGIFSMLTYEW